MECRYHPVEAYTHRCHIVPRYLCWRSEPLGPCDTACRHWVRQQLVQVEGDWAL